MVGRDDNEVLNPYRGECKFAALHMSAIGGIADNESAPV
jgi:hypothetical protein